MKALTIMITLVILFLPCLYYQPSGVASVGYQVVEVIEISYGSLVDDLSKIGS